VAAYLVASRIVLSSIVLVIILSLVCSIEEYDAIVNSLNFLCKSADRLCGLVARVPGYRTEMYCVSCEVQTELIYVM
jgi:hypothetical protein